MNLHPIPIDDSTLPDKRARYTPDLLPYAISIAYEDSVITLTAPYDPPQVLALTSGDPNPNNFMNKYNPVHGRVKRGYWSRRRDGKIYIKNHFLLLHVL